MNFFENIADTQITRGLSRSFFPLPAIQARRPRVRAADRVIARAAVLEVLG